MSDPGRNVVTGTETGNLATAKGQKQMDGFYILITTLGPMLEAMGFAFRAIEPEDWSFHSTGYQLFVAGRTAFAGFAVSVCWHSCLERR